MKKRTKAMLSWLLALCMLLSGLPWAPTVVAVELENVPNVAIENEDTPVDEEITIVEEDITLRGEYEKHYLMSDGSYQAVVYSSPVHELVDGVWVEIESTNQNARGSISTDTERTNIVDNYVLQGAGVQDRNRDRLYIGNRSEGLTRAFIRFVTMPTLPSGAIITHATMSLTLTNGTGTAANASAYMVTGGSWESGEIQWSNMPATDTLLQSNISHNNCTGYSFSCLTAVQHWYTGDTTGQNENYGIMLRYYDETVDDYNAVYSADHTDASLRPSLAITYQPPSSTIRVLEGDTYALTVPNASGTIIWTSSNESAATVDSTGKVTAIKTGKTIISATVDDIVQKEFTVYVTIADGVYYIKNGTTLCLGTYGRIADGTDTRLFAKATSGRPQLNQLWKIKYLDSGYYSIRPLYKLDMGLCSANGLQGNVEIATVGTSDTISSIPENHRWTIESNSSGYLFCCAGAAYLTMQASVPYPGASVVTKSYSSSESGFLWNLEKVNGIANQVLLLDTQTGSSVENATRYLEIGETNTSAGLGITASFVCPYDTDQSITWSTVDSSVVSVNSLTGEITGLSSGETATIVATHTLNGVAYKNYYTIYVTETSAPIFQIKHYYDQGYNVREGNALTAIQSYHNIVKSRLESIFGVRLLETIEMYSSQCDLCKLQQNGSITTDTIDSACSHTPGCLNSPSVRADLQSQKGVGDETTTVVIWAGHRMTNADSSSSDGITHTVLITTTMVSNWSATSDKNASRVFTLIHELSHQLGADDHYCHGSSPGEPCGNPKCDTCYFGYSTARQCVMSRRQDISTVSDNELYCDDCLELISAHLEDHH